jgi:large subunit ribosomal protein L6
MSRVGKKPIKIPDGVEVRVEGSTLTVKGPKGELRRTFDADMDLAVEDGALFVRRPTDQSRHRALHGLTRSLAANMVTGVSQGFQRSL